MDGELFIRKFEKQDIPGLRKLCADTAYFGEPCENFFSDRELLADLIMQYYLEYESEHTWVAEYKGEIVGYLSAGLDDAKYSFYMIGRILPGAILKAFLRGLIWDKRIGNLIKYNIACFLKRQISIKKVDEKKYSVHIHQNIKKGFRGKRIGSKLVEEFLSYIKPKKLGIRFKALRQEDKFMFFEKYGFKKIDCKRVPIWEKWLRKEPLYYMQYVKDPAL